MIFNIRDSDWNPNIHYHSVHTKDLLTIADSLGLELSHLLNSGPMRFADNRRDTNSVLDLVFMALNNQGFGRHTLHPESHKLLDHVLLSITVGIKEENIDITTQTIKKNSDKEKEFIESIKNKIRRLDMSKLLSQENLQRCANKLAEIYGEAWTRHSKTKCITKYSKEWWNQSCTNCLHKYHEQGDLQSWK